MKLAQLIWTAALTSVSASAFASANNNYYVAANVGIFQGNFNNKYLDQSDVIPLNIAQTANQNGYTGGVAIGYRQLMRQQYFLGGELSANMDTNSASYQSGSSTTIFSDQIKIKDHFDLTFVPGLMFSGSVAAYLKLGLSYALLEDTLTSPAGFTPTMTNYHGNKNALGFAAGLGISKPLTNQVNIFTEANYHDYGSIDFSNFQNFGATYTHSTHVYSYDVVIGLAYTF